MAVIVAVHAFLISSIYWTTQGIPAAATVPILIADLYAVFAIFSVVWKFVERPKVSAR